MGPQKFENEIMELSICGNNFEASAFSDVM